MDQVSLWVDELKFLLLLLKDEDEVYVKIYDVVRVVVMLIVGKGNMLILVFIICDYYFLKELLSLIFFFNFYYICFNVLLFYVFFL